MGAGAYVRIINISALSVTTYIPDKECFFDGGTEGSWLSKFDNRQIAANSSYPIQDRIYIEARNSGVCWGATKTFTMRIAPQEGEIRDLHFSVDAKNNDYSVDTAKNVAVAIVSAPARVVIEIFIFIPIPVTNGMRVRIPNGAIFLVMDNMLRGIPNMGIFTNLFKDGSTTAIINLGDYTLGPLLNEEVRLIRRPDGLIALNVDGVARGMRNMTVFNGYNFDMAKVVELTYEQFAAIPLGEPLPFDELPKNEVDD